MTKYSGPCIYTLSFSELAVLASWVREVFRTESSAASTEARCGAENHPGSCRLLKHAETVPLAASLQATELITAPTTATTTTTTATTTTTTTHHQHDED